MVETRSGRSASPPLEGTAEDVSPRASPERGQKQKDTAASRATAGVLARAGRRGPCGARGAGAGQPPFSDSQLYTMLALELMGMALPCVFMPKLAARAAFGSAAYPPEDQHTHTLGLLASGLMAAASVAFALEECARKHMMHTFTADTLKMSLFLFAAGNILLQLWHPTALSAPAALMAIVTQGTLLALPASQLFTTAEDRNRVWRDLKRLPRNLGGALSLRKPSLPAGLYLLLMLAFVPAGLAYILAPQTTLYHTFGYAYGLSTFFTWRSVGAGLLTILPLMAYTLKDKAENDLLGRSVSRTLNLGLMAASIGHLLVFGPILNNGNGGALLSGLTATWGLALVASMAGLAAPEAAAMAEAAAEAARTE